MGYSIKIAAALLMGSTFTTHASETFKHSNSSSSSSSSSSNPQRVVSLQEQIVELRRATECPDLSCLRRLIENGYAAYVPALSPEGQPLYQAICYATHMQNAPALGVLLDYFKNTYPLGHRFYLHYPGVMAINHNNEILIRMLIDADPTITLAQYQCPEHYQGPLHAFVQQAAAPYPWGYNINPRVMEELLAHGTPTGTRDFEQLTALERSLSIREQAGQQFISLALFFKDPLLVLKTRAHLQVDIPEFAFSQELQDLFNDIYSALAQGRSSLIDQFINQLTNIRNTIIIRDLPDSAIIQSHLPEELFEEYESSILAPILAGQLRGDPTNPSTLNLLDHLRGTLRYLDEDRSQEETESELEDRHELRTALEQIKLLHEALRQLKQIRLQADYMHRLNTINVTALQYGAPLPSAQVAPNFAYNMYESHPIFNAIFRGDETAITNNLVRSEEYAPQFSYALSLAIGRENPNMIRRLLESGLTLEPWEVRQLLDQVKHILSRLSQGPEQQFNLLTIRELLLNYLRPLPQAVARGDQTLLTRDFIQEHSLDFSYALILAIEIENAELVKLLVNGHGPLSSDLQQSALQLVRDILLNTQALTPAARENLILIEQLILNPVRSTSQSSTSSTSSEATLNRVRLVAPRGIRVEPPTFLGLSSSFTPPGDFGEK